MGRKRKGFLFTMPLMLGMGILVFASMIAISQLFVGIGGPLVPDLLADMPTIFDYDPDGKRMPQNMPILSSGEDIVIDDAGTTVSEEEFSKLFPSIAMYGLMVKIALGIFAVLIMLAGVSYFFEEFNIVRPGTAYGIVAKLIILVPIYLALPYLWDMVALVIESSALYLMDPFGGDPHGRTTQLWCLMGSVTCNIDGTTSIDPVNIFEDIHVYDRDSILNQDSWNQSLQNPLFGEDFMINVLLSLFKGFAIMFMTAMMFVLSAIRVMLTEVIVVSFPLVTAIGLIPWINTRRIADMFQQNLIGLALAPIMSSIVLSIGLSTIDSQNMPPLRMWFQLLSVGFLSVFFPIMLSPMLGNLSTKVGNMVSTSIHSVSIAGSGALRGAVNGISQASSAVNLAGNISGPIPAGMASRTEDMESRFTSASIGTATSGVTPGRLSVLDRIGMYGKAGMSGIVGGMGAGMLTSTTGAMGVGAAASGMANQVLHSRDTAIYNAAHAALARNGAQNIADRMLAMESKNMNNYVQQHEHHTLLNPGPLLNSVQDNSRSFDLGQQIIHDETTKQEFASMMEQEYNITKMDLKIKEEFVKNINKHAASHPTAAGELYDTRRQR